MEGFLTLFSGGAPEEKKEADSLLALAPVFSENGIILTREQAALIASARSSALRANGRLEFSGGTAEKIARAFCDSPYTDSGNFAAVVSELLELFYYYKNETDDKISDDELIAYMKKYYNGVCRGSLELLAAVELERLSRETRAGKKPAFDLPDGGDVTDDAAFYEDSGEYGAEDGTENER